MSKTPKMKRLRRHGDAPANWQYRDGRPRWIPSPSLRKAGWTARDLKDAGGVFLSEGLSRDLARDINAQVAAWRRGEQVAADFAAIAPAGAALDDGERPPSAAADPLAIGPLIDAFLTSPEIVGAVDARGARTGGLAANTQKNYRLGLKRLVDALAGYADQPDPADPVAMAAYARAVAVVRASNIFVLRPAKGEMGMIRLLNDAYHALIAAAGQHQAHAVMAATSAWLRWCRDARDDQIDRWTSRVKRETPPGRVRPWTVPEYLAMVAAADKLGLHSIGDSIVLGLDLSWSQADRLDLDWGRLIGDRQRGFRAWTRTQLTALRGEKTGRQKTGRVGGTPLTSLGRARVLQIIARQEAMPAKPTHVLICETTKRPWKRKTYGDAFALVRAEAAKSCPSVLDRTGDDGAALRGVWDADLRDTAFTWMKNAGLSNAGIASRTLQGLKQIDDLSDNNYGEIGPEIADPARDQYDAYLIRVLDPDASEVA